MKVLLLATHLNTGGIAVYTVNLARYLKKAGIDVTVASSGGELEGILKSEEIEHETIDIRTKFEFGIKTWKALPFLKRFVKDKGFDLIHSQTRVTQVLGELLSLKTGVSLVTTCHGFFKHRRIGRRLFPCWGQKVIAISDNVRRHLVEDFRLTDERVTRVYNGIELDRYSNPGAGAKKSDLKKRIGLRDDALLVGTTGRLSRVKGQKYLVSAFKEAADEYPRLQLLIVGEGGEKRLLEKQVRDLKISSDVFFVSGKDTPLEEYLFLMDIFCLASVSEGLGLSLMEAMAAGRACVASDIGGLSELITQGEDGILVTPKDPAAIKEAVLRLARDGELRKKTGEAARKKAINEFSIEKSVAETIKVYREALK